jgi:hypothetical protein
MFTRTVQCAFCLRASQQFFMYKIILTGRIGASIGYIIL